MKWGEENSDVPAGEPGSSPLHLEGLDLGVVPAEDAAGRTVTVLVGVGEWLKLSRPPLFDDEDDTDSCGLSRSTSMTMTDT